MIKERYMVWAMRPEDPTETDHDVRGFETLDRATEYATKYARRHGVSTVVEQQWYEISRRDGYQILESLFLPWGCDPDGRPA